MKRIICLTALAITTLAGTAQAATVTVTVADDGVSNIGSPGTFYWAITNANAGDTIAFNIPGGGPHYLKIPPGGFPLVYKKNNLTIDGYTQPGSSPNSNPITGANNAVIKIVVDGRNGHNRNMAYETYNGTLASSDPPIDNTSMSTDRSGYGSDERALLGVYRTSGITIKGIAFLGTLASVEAGDVKGICFAHDYDLNTNNLGNAFAYASGSDGNAHINGCWFGVDPANPTMAGVVPSGMAMAAYRHRAASGNPRPELPNIGMTFGVKAKSANARAEFNVIVAHAYAFDVEAIRMTVSGNFFGVLPDGVTPYNTTELAPGNFAGGQFEFGRYADTVPMIVGTDGDGVNDADEGNIFGPLAPIGENKQTQMDIYGFARKPWIVAGNRFGVAGNGTVWTNSSFTIGEFRIADGAQTRFGSDFNGVSDALEANIVNENNTFNDLFPTPALTTAPSLILAVDRIAATDGWLSVRGNSFVNTFPLYNPEQNGGQYTNTWNRFFPDVDNKIPVLTASTTSTLNGTFNAPTNNYTTVVIDVYLPDPAAQVNGALFDYAFFGGVAGPGFVNGKTHLGSFLDNGPQDSNPAVGAFSLNISSLGLASGAKVTVAVTYSAFALPNLAIPAVSGGNVTLTWTGSNGGPFNTPGQGGPSSGFGVQSATSITGPWTTTFAAGNSAVLSAGASASFYRIVAPISGMTSLCATPVTLP